MVSVISDSTCDLSDELIRKYDITIIPLHVILDETDYLDGVTITPDEIYAWSDEHKQTPKTAAVSVEEVMDCCKKRLQETSEIILFSISSEMSSSYNSCCLAVQEMELEDRIHVIDSRNLSTGIGLMVVHAAILAQSGKSATEIETEILAMRPNIRASFVVDTLVYLQRGGRCSGLAAMVGGALKLHPKIIVHEGSMSPGKKYRGKTQKFVMDYVREMESDYMSAKADRVFITHSGCDEAIIEAVYAYLENLHHFEEILITRAGSVISSHCGRGTLGVLFAADV